MLEFGEFSCATAQVGQPEYRVYWSWSCDGLEVDETALLRSHWSLRLPLVKDGVEWGFLYLYRSLDDETFLVTTNYLADLFRREFTDAAARIFTMHEEPVLEVQSSAFRLPSPASRPQAKA
jgi:hypothetical protein